jgi:hypothetical protein
MYSFLLIGQSNMAGRGNPQNVERFNPEGIKLLRNGLWTFGYRPVNPDRKSAGVCLAESFAEEFVKKYNTEVGLIPCADGGTSLDQWQKGEALYENAVFQGKLASRSSKLTAVLWHQGESDCDPLLYPTYRPRLEKMMADLRRDLNIPEVPFLVGGLGDFLADCHRFENLKNYTHINKALREIAEQNDNVGFVCAEGLGASSDNLHFNGASLREFGRRYFAKFEEMADPDLLTADDSVGGAIERSSIEQL